MDVHNKQISTCSRNANLCMTSDFLSDLLLAPPLLLSSFLGLMRNCSTAQLVESPISVSIKKNILLCSEKAARFFSVLQVYEDMNKEPLSFWHLVVDNDSFIKSSCPYSCFATVHLHLVRVVDVHELSPNKFLQIKVIFLLSTS